MKRSRKKAFDKTNYMIPNFLSLPGYDSRRISPIVAETLFQIKILFWVLEGKA